jgi:DNA mismatch endonuclease, patch repair protein
VVDTRTPEQRRRIMAAVRSTDTAPEVRLRRALYAAGVRGWRCHYKGAPGRPDLAWPSLRVAVFVDGAFWHGHPSRHKAGRSGAYWDEKIARNAERDRQADAALEGNGWSVVRVWDFEVARELDAVVERVTEVLRERTSDTVRWQRRLARPGAAPATREGRPDVRDDAAAEQRSRFGENLRDARQRAGISRQQLAMAAGLSESTIRLYERGAREPNLRTIVKLTRGLGIAPKALVRSL